MSELQNDDYDEELENSEELDEEIDDSFEEDEESDDLASDSEDEHEETSDDDNDGDDRDNQESIERVIAKKHFEAKEAERRAEQAEAKLAEIESQQLQNSEPKIPEIPDRDDFDYDDKMAAREAAIKDHNEWETKVNESNQKLQENAQRQQQREIEEVQQLAQTYNERAAKQKVSQQDLEKAKTTIVPILQNNPEVARAILQDEHGPLITRYLTKNVGEAITLAGMSGFEAAKHIERNIRPKVKLKPKKGSGKKPTRRVKTQSRANEGRFPLTSKKKISFE